MGSGKSLAAKIICELLCSKGHTCTTLSIATELKRVAKSLGWNGEKDKKGRLGLQLLGTDVVRNCFDQDYWIKSWERQFMNTGADYVICDDVRFPNEESVIRALGGVVLQIRLNGLVSVETHASEQVDLLSPDVTIWSDRGEDNLRKALLQSNMLREYI